MSEDPILDIDRLRIEVRTDAGPGPVLVDDISFTLQKGHVLGLIGESGAGKSTIGMAILGYTRANIQIGTRRLTFVLLICASGL